MINGELDLNKLIREKLSTLSIDRDGSSESVPVVYGIPEAEVLEEAIIPGASLIFLWDQEFAENSGRRLQGGPPTRPVDANDLSLGYEVVRRPHYRRFTYQLDLYTHEQLDMLYLVQGLHVLIPRERGFLTDADGNYIHFRVDDTRNETREMEEERLFKRNLTLTFDAWVLESDEPTDTIGPVEHINVDIRDEDSDEQLSNEWYPEDPNA